MEQKFTILDGYSDMEKGAYLGAIASLSTADRIASEEELEYINALCESANLSKEQAGLINNAAESEMSDDDLKRCLDVLKTSELRYSLISDVIAFAQSDQSYVEEEKHSISKMAEYLGVNGEQVSMLDQFTKKAVEEAPQHAEDNNENISPAGFLDKLGFGDKLKGVGINSNTLLKGAIGILGPLLLAKMFSGRRRTAGVSAGGSGGGLLGGLLGGGLGSLLAKGGGLLGGLLGGGRGFGNAGGMLSRIFKGLGR